MYFYWRKQLEQFTIPNKLSLIVGQFLEQSKNVTHQYMVAVDTDDTQKDSQEGCEKEPCVLEGIAHCEHARANVALYQVKQGLPEPEIDKELKTYTYYV